MSEEKAVKTTYEKQRHNDHNAVRLFINKCMEKRGTLHIPDGMTKFEVLKALWEKKTSDREVYGNGSLRTIFPDRFDEQKEDQWLQDTFRVFLDRRSGKGADQDPDDPEDAYLQRKVKQENIKQEDGEFDTGLGDKAALDDESTEEAEEGPEYKIFCNPICRRVADAIALANKSAEKANRSSQVSDAGAEPLTIAMRPHWKWVNMKLVVWRPSEHAAGGGTGRRESSARMTISPH